MLLLFLVLGGIVAFLIASGIAGATRRLTGNDALALAVGTFSMPALILASLAYWLVTMEVEDAPPGNVVLGNLFVVCLITLVALLASHLTLKFLARRSLRNGR